MCKQMKETKHTALSPDSRHRQAKHKPTKTIILITDNTAWRLTDQLTMSLTLWQQLMWSLQFDNGQ